MISFKFQGLAIPTNLYGESVHPLLKHLQGFLIARGLSAWNCVLKLVIYNKSTTGTCNVEIFSSKAPQNNNLRFFHTQKRRWKRCTSRQFPSSFRNLRKMELPFRKRECVYCWSTTWTCAVESSSSVWRVIKRYMCILIPWERFW